MSTTVTMRPRRLSTPAISADDSGTRVRRSGMNTSCTREIGRPNNCPPITAVTYSATMPSLDWTLLLIETAPYAAWLSSAVCSFSAAIRPGRSNLAT